MTVENLEPIPRITRLKENVVFSCPVCGSEDLKAEEDGESDAWTGEWKCLDCEGVFSIEEIGGEGLRVLPGGHGQPCRRSF